MRSSAVKSYFYNLMKGAVYTVLFFALFLAAYAKPQNKLYIISDNAAHLKKGDEVDMNGLPVGKISAVSLIKDFKIAIEISLNDEVTVPTGSKFKVIYTDTLTPRILTILPAKSTGFIPKGDTVKYNLEPRSMRADSALMITINKLDSLLKEIK